MQKKLDREIEFFTVYLATSFIIFAVSNDQPRDENITMVAAAISTRWAKTHKSARKLPLDDLGCLFIIASWDGVLLDQNFHQRESK